MAGLLFPNDVQVLEVLEVLSVMSFTASMGAAGENGLFPAVDDSSQGSAESTQNEIFGRSGHFPWQINR